MGRLDGKVAIITGAAMGQGAEEAALFAREGAKVVATDIQVDTLEQVVKGITSKGGQAIAIKHDVSDEENWKTVVAEAADTFGKINILVNNAGIVIQEAIADTSLESFNKVMNINSTGTFLGMKHVIPEMKKVGGGSIVNISSISGIIGSGGAGYNASKGAVRTMTKNAALDYAKDKIRVNSVHPGVIKTPMTKDILDSEEGKKGMEAMTPLPYFGEPIDVAYGVLYLASDEARFTTGSELVIDGGSLAQ